MGPTLKISQEIHSLKHRQPGESFEEAITRVCNTLKDDDKHFKSIREICLDMRFLFGGRIMAASGGLRKSTPYNCFVSQPIEDSLDSIMESAHRGATTMKLGGGIGYGFSRIRPGGSLVTSLDTEATGPVSFMHIHDAVCGTIAAAGHRRGAQMGVLRIDHPDVEEFITCKQNSDKLTNFNISLGVTDEFMQAVKNDDEFALVFEGKIHKWVWARDLWEKIMRSTWDWAEPGILFIDRINKQNNLWYCETIEATNPCAEQPLPPNGACLLGSMNLVKYLKARGDGWEFDLQQFRKDIPHIVRAMDNVVDTALYPLPEQETEAKAKRRMGIGVTGLANAGEMLGFSYASTDFLVWTSQVLRELRDSCYRASVELAKEKGAFPMFQWDKYCEAPFIKALPEDIQQAMKTHGIRNSHLLSIAPTGTISLCADNVSSGIEPPFSHSYERTIIGPDGVRKEIVEDYAYRVAGVKGRTSTNITVQDHLNVLLIAQKYVDSSVSKTCNVDPDTPWHEFKDVYMKAYDGGAKGVTTFNPKGKRYGILNEKPTVGQNPAEVPGAACYIDPDTGEKECS